MKSFSFKSITPSEKYFKETSFLFIYRVLTVLINLVTGIIITRYIGESNRGVYGLYLTSLLLFNTFLNLGYNLSIVYYAKREEDKLPNILSFAFILSFVSSFIIYISLFLFSEVFKFQSFETNVLFSITYFFFASGNIFRNLLLGKGQFLYTNKIDLYNKFFFLFIITILIVSDKLDLHTILILVLIENIAFYFFSLKRIKIRLFPLKIDWSYLKTTFVFNFKAFLSAFIVLLILRCDQYFIKIIMGNYYVGLYSTNSTIIENLSIVGTIVSTQFFPKMIEEKDFIVKLKKSFSPLVLLGVIGLLISIVMYMLSPYIIHIYFKREIPEAIESLRVLLIGFVFWTVYNFLHVLYISIQVKKTYLIFLVITLILNVVLNKILIPKMGIVGSSWASVVCYAFLFFASFIDLFFLKKRNEIKRKMND